MTWKSNIFKTLKVAIRHASGIQRPHWTRLHVQWWDVGDEIMSGCTLVDDEFSTSSGFP